MRTKHTMNGDQQNGWYCYQCDFFTRDVALAAEHDGSFENYETGYRRGFREGIEAAAKLAERAKIEWRTNSDVADTLADLADDIRSLSHPAKKESQ